MVSSGNHREISSWDPGLHLQIGPHFGFPSIIGVGGTRVVPRPFPPRLGGNGVTHGVLQASRNRTKLLGRFPAAGGQRKPQVPFEPFAKLVQLAEKLRSSERLATLTVCARFFLGGGFGPAKTASALLPLSRENLNQNWVPKTWLGGSHGSQPFCWALTILVVGSPLTHEQLFELLADLKTERTQESPYFPSWL